MRVDAGELMIITEILKKRFQNLTASELIGLRTQILTDLEKYRETNRDGE